MLLFEVRILFYVFDFLLGILVGAGLLAFMTNIWFIRVIPKADYKTLDEAE